MNNMTNNHDRAPIAIFTYNRLDHIKKTIDALLENVLAEDSNVYIFSDGYKNLDDKEQVLQVRRYLHDLRGFKKIEIIERAFNFGCADNVVFGISEVFERHDSIIVVEDDVITSKWFLKYMNDALIYYEKEKKVMAISGFLPPVSTAGLPETFFTDIFECWGWATWKRSWKCMTRNTNLILKNTTPKEKYRINARGSMNYWNHLLENYKGVRKTWAIYFHISIVKNKGLVLENSLHLCKNIGLDGSGDNCGVDQTAGGIELGEHQVKRFTKQVRINKEAMKRLIEYNNKQRKRYNLIYKAIIMLRDEGGKVFLGMLYKRLRSFYGKRI